MSIIQAPFTALIGGGGLTNFDIITNTSTTDVNLRTLLDARGFDNTLASTISYTLKSGVVITATSAGVDAWQTGTIGSIHTVAVSIGGTITCYQGDGGALVSGAESSHNGNPGSSGSDSMSFVCDAQLNIASGSTVRGGGGGGRGGAGSHQVDDDYNDRYGNGGAGGDGQGATNTTADSGQGGTSESGTGVTAIGGDGGDGGDYGEDGVDGGDGNDGSTGGSAGSGGYAVRKNDYTVSVTNNGTTHGTIG